MIGLRVIEVVMCHWHTITRSELIVFSSFSLSLSLVIEGPRQDTMTIVRLVRGIGHMAVLPTVFIIALSIIRACGRVNIAHISLSIIVFTMMTTLAVLIISRFVDQRVLLSLNMVLL